MNRIRWQAGRALGLWILLAASGTPVADAAGAEEFSRAAPVAQEIAAVRDRREREFTRFLATMLEGGSRFFAGESGAAPETRLVRGWRVTGTVARGTRLEISAAFEVIGVIRRDETGKTIARESLPAPRIDRVTYVYRDTPEGPELVSATEPVEFVLGVPAPAPVPSPSASASALPPPLPAPVLPPPPAGRIRSGSR